ncbi:hypothetical protein FOCC_FOCC013792 [Frankliniella occidentalis]|nr:hypothetical protein FOCC_FOCC013792 [Frankliniella occidentalis]
MKNEKWKYDTIRRCGWTTKPPLFMARNPHRKRQQQETSLGPLGEGATFPSETRSCLGEPVAPDEALAHPPPSAPSPDQPDEVCDDCQVEWEGDCPLHGPLLVVADTEVAVGHPDRALLTVPPQLAVLVSKIPGAGLGVWTREAVPRRILRGGKRTHCVDALDMTTSNWMRFVNCARHSGEENVVPYQLGGRLYYRTVRDVPANTELLTWYGDSYARDLGISPGAYRDPARDTRTLSESC